VNQAYFTKQNATLLKGFLILVIIAHNISNYIYPWFFSNEKGYEGWILPAYFLWCQENPFYIPKMILTFFGHYAVESFVILSGYALAVLQSQEEWKFKSFFKKAFLKLYIPYLIGIFIYYIITTLALLPVISLKEILLNNYPFFFQSIFLVANFIPGSLFISPSTFWFVMIILQLYLMFPLLSLVVKKGILLTILVSFVFLTLSYMIDNYTEFEVFGTALLHAPEFMLGMFFGYKKYFSIPNRFFIYIFAIFALSILSPVTHYFSYTLGGILILWLSTLSFKLKKLTKFFEKVGKNSLYLFLGNGIAYFPNTQILLHQYTLTPLTIISISAFLLETVLFAIIIKKITKYITGELKFVKEAY